MANPSSDRFADLVRSNRHNRDSALLRATTELFTLDMDHGRDEIRQYEELATHLLPKVTESDRIFVSGRLAPISDAPVAVLRALARDTLVVAAAVIKNSPALTSFDLLSIIAATGPEHHRLIAERSSLSDDVKHALLLTPTIKAATTAESNPPTPPPDPSAGSVEASLAPSISPTEFTGGWDFLNLEQVDRKRAVAKLAGAPAADNLDPGKPRAAFQKIVSTAQVIGFARGGQIGKMTRAISDSLQIPQDFVTASVSDASGEALAILLRALRLDDTTAQQVILLTSPAGRDTAAFFPLSDFHAGMETYVAEGMIEQWQDAHSRAATHEPIFQDAIRQRADRTHIGHRAGVGAETTDRARRA